MHPDGFLLHILGPWQNYPQDYRFEPPAPLFMELIFIIYFSPSPLVHMDHYRLPALASNAAFLSLLFFCLNVFY
jgi:hypothetical protein